MVLRRFWASLLDVEPPLRMRIKRAPRLVEAPSAAGFSDCRLARLDAPGRKLASVEEMMEVGDRGEAEW